MPDLDLDTASGPTRVYELMHDAAHLLLNFGDVGRFDIDRARHVRVVDARVTGQWELPVIGHVEAPTAVLIRPDGHVAWAQGSGGTLDEALALWCGATV
jgi:hypothetical protein